MQFYSQLWSQKRGIGWFPLSLEPLKRLKMQRWNWMDEGLRSADRPAQFGIRERAKVKGAHTHTHTHWFCKSNVSRRKGWPAKWCFPRWPQLRAGVFSGCPCSVCVWMIPVLILGDSGPLQLERHESKSDSRSSPQTAEWPGPEAFPCYSHLR